MTSTVTDPQPAVRPPDGQLPPQPHLVERLTVTPRLARRQREVCDLVAAGRSNPEIAEALGIAVNTVKTYVQTLLVLFGADNRTQLAVAYRLASSGLADATWVGELASQRDQLAARLAAALADLDRIRRGDAPTRADCRLASADRVLTSARIQPDDAAVIASAALTRDWRRGANRPATTPQATDKTGEWGVMTIAWPEAARPTPDVSSFEELRQWFLVGLQSAGSVLAEELAVRYARLALASRPEAVSDTSRGRVVCDPDPLDPHRPFWRDDDVWYSLDGLGKVEWVAGEPAETS